MSELVWGIKNGDLDQVREIVEKKVWDIIMILLIKFDVVWVIK